jgi:hypothetical protein
MIAQGECIAGKDKNGEKYARQRFICHKQRHQPPDTHY